MVKGSSPSAGGRALLDYPRVACICLAQLVERTTHNRRVVRFSTSRVNALFFVFLGMSGDRMTFGNCYELHQLYAFTQPDSLKK